MPLFARHWNKLTTGSAASEVRNGLRLDSEGLSTVGMPQPVSARNGRHAQKDSPIGEPLRAAWATEAIGGKLRAFVSSSVTRIQRIRRAFRLSRPPSQTSDGTILQNCAARPQLSEDIEQATEIERDALLLSFTPLLLASLGRDRAALCKKEAAACTSSEA